jgi:hypothetical protein
VATDDYTWLHELSVDQIRALMRSCLEPRIRRRLTRRGVHRVTVTKWTNHHREFVAEMNRGPTDVAQKAAAKVAELTNAALETVSVAVAGGDGMPPENGCGSSLWQPSPLDPQGLLTQTLLWTRNVTRWRCQVRLRWRPLLNSGTPNRELERRTASLLEDDGSPRQDYCRLRDTPHPCAIVRAGVSEDATLSQFLCAWRHCHGPGGVATPSAAVTEGWRSDFWDTARRT